MIKCPYCGKSGFKGVGALKGHIVFKHVKTEDLNKLKLGEPDLGLEKLDLGKPSESTEKSKLWIDLERDNIPLRKAIGVLRYFHPMRIWIGVKAFFLGKRGYGRIAIIDKNYRAHPYIIKLKDEIKIGKEKHVLEPQYSITGEDGLTTYFISQGSVVPIDMRTGARSTMDGEYLNYLIEKSRLGGLAMGMKDIQFMKMLLVGIAAVMVLILYFVYQLVEKGIV